MTAPHGGVRLPAGPSLLIRDYLELLDLGGIRPGDVQGAADRLGVTKDAMQKALERARRAGHLTPRGDR